MSVHSKPPGTLTHWSRHPTYADPRGCCGRCSRSCSPRAPRENAAPTADGEWSTQSRLQVGAGLMGPGGPGGRSQRPRLRACMDSFPQDAASNSRRPWAPDSGERPLLWGSWGKRGRPRPDLHSRFRWGPLSLEARGPRHACPPTRSTSADPADSGAVGTLALPARVHPGLSPPSSH